MERKVILAVDDAAINLASIENALKANYEVVTVNSGLRALRYLEREIPDLILLDIRMHYKSGIETLQDIRSSRQTRDIPVIMLTSARDRESVEECARLGISGYVLKPFEAGDLRMRIRQVLEGIEY